mmetsp:Transcript_18278/g.45468  ORF Transcript_18278/g.45468 Transcript_18278/m.45468 type:complete len:113 (-) Transcript_18278:1337-1675(-)
MSRSNTSGGFAGLPPAPRLSSNSNSGGGGGGSIRALNRNYSIDSSGSSVSGGSIGGGGGRGGFEGFDATVLEALRGRWQSHEVAMDVAGRDVARELEKSHTAFLRRIAVMAK